MPFSSCLKTHENNGADFNVLIYAEDINEAINAFQNKEIQIFERRWPDIMRDGDPYYNPNLTLKSQDFSLKRI